MFSFDNESDFDRNEWAELVMIADDIDLKTRMLLCEFGNMLNSRGQATTKPKVLAKTTGISEKDVRKQLTAAKNAGWLAPVEIDGRKGYQATIPV